jgi:hypothetical protein
MTKQSRLEEIALTLYHSYNGADGYYLPVEDAVAALTTYIEDEIIGPDEDLYRNSIGALSNDLRAAQRNKLRGTK